MVKKPLSKCQQAQQALEACRQLVADGGKVRDQLRERAEYAEKQLEASERKQEELATALREAQGVLELGATELRKSAASVRQNALANGAQPSWLVKDFNVLYRVALQLHDAVDTELDGVADKARRNLGAQLERLKSAFTDTEEVRALMRERQAEG